MKENPTSSSLGESKNLKKNLYKFGITWLDKTPSSGRDIEMELLLDIFPHKI